MRYSPEVLPTPAQTWTRIPRTGRRTLDGFPNMALQCRNAFIQRSIRRIFQCCLFQRKVPQFEILAQTWAFFSLRGGTLRSKVPCRRLGQQRRIEKQREELTV